ncbi:TOG array regulator of axonemal microtubules protein 1 isoform X1 [Osmerus eperlanus]|uniref:TOG array regulator of axonemal microtubules protein 1 isoform X1 n=1 Tax=Osmerus eperlanus TaxID=29151 RepID=UPI002E1219B9
MMIFGLLPQELHKQLLDSKNYQNRTNGVEELKHILLDLDLKPIPSDNIIEFINFLRRLLDDSNFKVLYGTLQVINLLIKKLDYNVEKYSKHIACAALKTLGDTRTVTRNEYMNVFLQLMRSVGPQKVLDLVLGHLRHKNSRVREDVINIITAAMLTHPRKEFNIPSLCFEVAPYLADSKMKVRHAALELFAVFDYCLDPGKKQPLMKAVDRVELSGDVEGLMAAVHARRARHLLPKLSSEGMVEYGLVVPRSGRRSQQCGSGADLEWVLSGGRGGSARSARQQPDPDRLCGYGSLGSLTDDLPLQRRIVSAGKGKNKLPWERSSLPYSEDAQPARVLQTNADQVIREDGLSLSRKLSPETYVPSFGSAEPPSSRRREPLTRLRRSGSLDSDPDIFKSTNFSATDGVATRGRLLSGNPSVERTFSLPSNPPAQGSFLLPCYPLAYLTAGGPSPTPPRRVESSVSMSNTWPNKRDSSPLCREPSPWTHSSGEASSSSSPRPLRASLVSSSSSTSCFRRALSSTRLALPVTPASPAQRDPLQPQNGQMSHPPQLGLQERGMLQEVSQLGLQEPEDESLDRQEMLNSLRSLRCSAAKKRAKVSVSGSDPDSPDSAVRLDLGVESPPRASPTGASPASESGLSSLYSPPLSSLGGSRTSPGNSASSKPRMARVPSAKLRSSVSMDFSCLQGPLSPAVVAALPPQDRVSAAVSVIGQRVPYSGEEPSPPPHRPTGREPIRALRPAKGSQSFSSRTSPASDMCEGVVGRGVFGPSGGSQPAVAVTAAQGDQLPGQLPAGVPPAGVHGLVVSGNHLDTEDTKEKTGASRDAQPQGQPRRQPLPGATEALDSALSTDLQLNNDTLAPIQTDSSPDSSPTSPQGSQSPPLKPSPPEAPPNPLKPSPPEAPPNPRALPRLRRAPSLSTTRPSLSHSSDELSAGSVGQKRDADQQPRPFSKPEQALAQSFRLLNLEDWEKKIEGVAVVRSLALFHPDVLLGRLHDVCVALIQEVKNLRSGVSRVAVGAVGELFCQLQRGVDQELEGLARALLLKAGESNAFIRQDVDAALDSMVQHCTPARCTCALIAGGLGHLSGVVRNRTAHHLTSLVEKMGATRILSGGKPSESLTERVLPAITRLAQDSSQEARFYGRRMLLFLSSHRDFDKMLEKHIPAKDMAAVRDTVFTLKTKGLGEMPQDTPSARGRRSLPGSGTVRASSLTREPLLTRDSQSSVRGQVQSVADKTEYVKNISALMASKDFRERIKGIDQLVSDCELNPALVISSMFPVFDAFMARLQESNSKVCLHALEALPRISSLMKEHLGSLVYLLVPAVVDNHLNSRNSSIYSAAMEALHALTLNLDTSLLLQPLCSKAQFLSGKAKVDLVEKVADLVAELYPRRPQMVEQRVLPLLWHLLGSSGGSGSVQGRGGSSLRGASASLCLALHTHMGPSLVDLAAAQPANIHTSLNELLRSLP